MRGSGGEGAPAGAGLDLISVAAGTLAGLVCLTVLGLAQGALGHGYPLSPAGERIGVFLVQGLASLLGGIWSARRAEGSGWLHGALAGFFLATALAGVMGVKDAFPQMLEFLRRAGASTALGALGGVLGVNLGGSR